MAEDGLNMDFGEHVCPKFMLNIMSTLPIPANDNKDKNGGKGKE